jgi:hypothetical protein
VTFRGVTAAASLKSSFQHVLGQDHAYPLRRDGRGLIEAAQTNDETERGQDDSAVVHCCGLIEGT